MAGLGADSLRAQQNQLDPLRTDLLSPPSLLQNTDLFEMIEKMQVRLAL